LRLIAFIRITITILFVFFISGAVSAAEVKRVVILKSHDAEPHEKTLKGFKDYLSRQDLKVKFKEYSFGGDVSKAKQVMVAVKKEGASLIFCIGSHAREVAFEANTGIPTIISMVLRLDHIEKETNATGIFLEFPWEVQFNWLKRFLPDCKTVGILYNPKENEKNILKAREIAQGLGFRLEPKKILTPRDLPPALESLVANADVLLGISDDVVLAPQTAQQLLLFSFRNRIPFIGISASWVEAGALYSLERDYRDIGSQCGEMALKVLQGTPAHSISPASPRKEMYNLNLRTANHMMIDISEEWVKNAHLVF